MKKEASFLAPESLAKRAGVTNTRYKVSDGRYILSEHDLRQIKLSMTPEEFVNGLDVEIITEEKAAQLMKDKGTVLGGSDEKEEKDKEEEV